MIKNRPTFRKAYIFWTTGLVLFLVFVAYWWLDSVAYDKDLEAYFKREVSESRHNQQGGLK